MKCYHCHGVLRRGETSFQLARHGYHLTLERVAAWVCDQCGETMFDDQQAAALQNLMQTMDEKAESLATRT
jgi:YgiT-type zinc finger domain-containing protein